MARVSCFITSTRRCWPLTLSVIIRSTEPAADCCARTTAVRNKYAEEDTAPAAMTPLIASRLDNPLGVSSITTSWVLDLMRHALYLRGMSSTRGVWEYSHGRGPELRRESRHSVADCGAGDL